MSLGTTTKNQLWNLKHQNNDILCSIEGLFFHLFKKCSMYCTIGQIYKISNVYWCFIIFFMMVAISDFLLRLYFLSTKLYLLSHNWE